jgi:hypothetical protein
MRAMLSHMVKLTHIRYTVKFLLRNMSAQLRPHISRKNPNSSRKLVPTLPMKNLLACMLLYRLKYLGVSGVVAQQSGGHSITDSP